MSDDERPLLDGELLRQLDRLRLSTLTAIVAGLVGERQGRARVARLEFADYRPYVPGDELRRIDWNVYRRLHQLVVKVGAEDGRLSLVLLVDTSRSMRVGQPSKARAAQRMAAALAAIALLRGDQAEVHALGDGHSRPLVRLDGPRQLTQLVYELERLPESLGTGLEAALSDYARGGRPSDVALLISDAHVPPEELEPALRTLASCARTAGLIHLVSEDELETELRGPVELRDAESGRAIETTLDDRTAAEYADRFAGFEDAVRDQCRELGLRYLRARSDEEALDLLLAHASDVAVTFA
ncbi:MAG TPA: DUF58 domain-containing protein [Gaiellales bacterium]|nr:DUF58 domain-containing protein [Gaiellales bacterium]